MHTSIDLLTYGTYTYTHLSMQTHWLSERAHFVAIIYIPIDCRVSQLLYRLHGQFHLKMFDAITSLMPHQFDKYYLVGLVFATVSLRFSSVQFIQRLTGKQKRSTQRPLATPNQCLIGTPFITS